MSVAFRRDSDEEHLEPKFELPIPAGPNLVTARGLRLIEERVAGLEALIADSTDPATSPAFNVICVTGRLGKSRPFWRQWLRARGWSSAQRFISR